MIRVITDISEFGALQKDWKKMIDGCPEDYIYNQPDFLKIWWDYFGKDKNRPILLRRGFEVVGEAGVLESPYILACFFESKIIGLLPLMLVRARLSGGGGFYRCLCFLGDAIFSPTPTIAIDQKYKELVFTEMADFLQNDRLWDIICLFPIQQEFRLLKKFIDALKMRIEARSLYADLYEVKFASHWKKEKVLPKLKRLVEHAPSNKANCQILEKIDEIERMDERLFSQKCR